MSFAFDPSAHPLRRLAAALFAGAVCQLAACGGAEPRASVTTTDAPVTVEDAEAELARLEASLERSFGPSTDTPGEPVAAPPPTTTSGGDAVTKKTAPASRCENACDALASMSRSADRICQLAGPGARCDAAKARVSSATTRVTAQCSECEP